MGTEISRPAFSVAMQLIDKAAELYNISPWELPRLNRGRRQFEPRFAVIWVLRRLNDVAVSQGHGPVYSYIKLARLVGYGHHTTGIYAHGEAVKLRQSDPRFRDLTDKLLAYAQHLGPQVHMPAAA